MSEQLSSADINFVMAAVHPVRAHWENFGIALGIAPDTVNAVGRTLFHNSDNCLRQIITDWLNKNYDVKRHGPPTVTRLCEAVASPVGGCNNALAEKIRPELLRKLRSQGHSSSASQLSGYQSTSQSSDSSVTAVVSDRELSDKELKDIAQQIGTELSLLAAELNCITTLEKYQIDPAKQANAGLFMLSAWYKAGGTRKDLVKALENIKLKNLSIEVARGLKDSSGQALPTNTPPVTTTPTSAATATPSPQITATPTASVASSAAVTDIHIMRCAKHMSGDFSDLAASLDVNDEQLQEIKNQFKKPSAQAIQLLKMWKKSNSQETCHDLKERLLALEFDEAARELPGQHATSTHINKIHK